MTIYWPDSFTGTPEVGALHDVCTPPDVPLRPRWDASPEDQEAFWSRDVDPRTLYTIAAALHHGSGTPMSECRAMAKAALLAGWTLRVADDG